MELRLFVDSGHCRDCPKSGIKFQQLPSLPLLSGIWNEISVVAATTIIVRNLE
jgi:hypothetical protein